MISFRTVLVTATVVLLTACASGESQSLDGLESSAKSEMRDARPGKPDFSQAAEKLGVSKEALQEAMKNAGGPPPDLDKVAEELGVSVDDLKAALPGRGKRAK